MTKTITLINVTFLILLTLASLTPAYGIAASLKQQHFIQFMLPKIEKANAQIAKDRNKLIQFKKKYFITGKLTLKQQHWIIKLAKQYAVKHFAINNKHNWQILLNRVDIVPADLILAQAINESAWGQSRFAKLGNNYFGQWCSTPGCGIIPKQRPKGATYQVKKFATALASVKSYLHNLNTYSAYSQLRQIRMELRKENKPLSGVALAVGLMYYSTRRQDYVNTIQDIIKVHNLQHYNSRLAGASHKKALNLS